MDGENDDEATEIVTVSVPHSIYLVLRAYATFQHVTESSIVETALENFLDIVERCDPEARAVALSLSETNE